MMRVSLLVGLMFFGIISLNGQGKFGATPEDSVTCLQSVSVGDENYKNKQYNEALKYYKIVISVCPKARKSAFANTAKIYSGKVKQAKNNPEVKELMIDSLMLIYDGRIANFGQRGYVLEKKGRDHLKYRPKQPEVAYAMFEEALRLRGNKMGASSIGKMYKARYRMFKMDMCTKEELIEQYPVLKAIADFNIKNSKKEKNIKNYKTANENLLQYFKEVASCEDLVGAFKPKFEGNPNDVELISGVLELLNAKECEDSDFYIAVAKRLQELSPSPLAAWSIANWYVKKEKCTEAINYYIEAFSLADSLPEAEKASFKVKAALRAGYCYLSKGEYSNAKLMANKALSVDKYSGEAYMIIGDAYYGGSASVGENPCAKKAGNWAAVDKYQKALAKDAELKAKIGKKIANAKSRYPSKEQCFFYTINEGDSYKVIGWINETTTARFNN